MLSRKHRLHRDQDIKQVLRGGKRLHTPLAACTVVKTSNGQDARIGIVAGKKVHASAVVRHRVQRFLREVARDVLQQYPHGYDMVVVAKPPAADTREKADFKELYTLITTTLSNLT